MMNAQEVLEKLERGEWKMAMLMPVGGDLDRVTIALGPEVHYFPLGHGEWRLEGDVAQAQFYQPLATVGTGIVPQLECVRDADGQHLPGPLPDSGRFWQAIRVAHFGPECGPYRAASKLGSASLLLANAKLAVRSLFSKKA